jgi:hypothetical protein
MAEFFNSIDPFQKFPIELLAGGHGRQAEFSRRAGF